jgi:tRNA (guanine-N7-)-methyltransferase
VSKKKLIHLAELETFPNVFQMRTDLKGKWNDAVFENENPIVLELACGKGEYALALAEKFPQENFIGIDIKGARLWRGAKSALERNMKNVVFLRTYIDHVTSYFDKEEVAEIWITFPDPYHENSKARKRLTSEIFMLRYKDILKHGGLIHLKTDDLLLYEYTVDVVKNIGAQLIFQTRDLYLEIGVNEILKVKTYYEKQHLINAKTIKYLQFCFK